MMLSHILSVAAVAATASAAFDPLSKNNVITYWGQGANQERLIETCKNSAYDIINVGFVNVFPDQGKGGWPGTNFGNACWGDVYQNEKGVDTDLLKTCPNIGEDVVACQQTYGKKIFLSLGGGHGDYYLNNAASARHFANFLWAAFGPASASKSDVPRPWGDAAVDGFDFDIESLIRPNYYADMIKRFKNALFPTDTSKPYYISGAPQCGIPDAHFTDVVANSWFDFLFIQFYNTDGCSARDGIKKINGRGSDDISFLQWVASKSLNPKVRMSIGLPAAKKASRLPKYYLNPTEVQKLAKKFYKQKLFGGIMLWEATSAANNKPCQTDYGTWMKNILIGQANGKDIKTTCPAKRDLPEYEEAPESTSFRCTSTVTLTRSRSSSAPAYQATETASSPAAAVTTSMPAYSVSKAYGSSSSSADVELCTKTTTLIFRSGSETRTYVEPCPSSCTPKSSSSLGSSPAYSSSAAPPGPASSSAASYAASPEESAPAESYPASPEESSPAPSYAASEACGDEVTVTTTEQSTVYVTATANAPSEHVTSMTTVQSMSTIYETHHVWMTKYPSASAPGYGRPSSASSAEASSPSEYENSAVGGQGESSSAPAQANPSHGHHHGQRPSHSHGDVASSAVAGPHVGEEGPQSTTTVINVVTVVPIPATSGVAAAAQPTGESEAPYPYGPMGGNGTAPAGTASGTGAPWPTYAGPQQTGGAGVVGVSGTLMTGVCLLGLVML